MWRLIVIAAFCTLACSCRCQSDLQAPSDDAGSAAVTKDVPILRWCRACALRSFLSCKRVTSVGTEDEVRRKAELTACADIGYTEAECTPDKIRFAECGLEPTP